MAQILLNALDYPDSELSILIVDDLQISELNKNYLNKIGSTNVIAFPMNEGRFTNINPDIIGDVVVSIDTAEREGNESGVGMFWRFIELLVHGILHLIGYDHTKSEADFAIMSRESDKLLFLLKKNFE